MTRLDTALDARPGAAPASTGSLRDGGHAVTVEGTLVQGVQAVEIIVVWRVENVVNSLVAEGSLGGLRARPSSSPWRRAQTGTELGR